MQGWLQKMANKWASVNKSDAVRTITSVPVNQKTGHVPTQPRARQHQPHRADLPNATVIYGIGASFLFIASFFILLGGRWFAALGVFALGLCLVGFAVHLMKYRD